MKTRNGLNVFRTVGEFNRKVANLKKEGKTLVGFDSELGLARLAGRDNMGFAFEENKESIFSWNWVEASVPQKIRFSDIKPGTVFSHENKYYVKLDNDRAVATEELAQEIVHFSSQAKIEKHNI